MNKKLRTLSFDRSEGPKVGDWGKVLNGAAPMGGLACVLDVNEADSFCLVEFLQSDEELHDGNIGRVRGKKHHCWWVGTEDILPIAMGCQIFREGREVLCIPGVTGRKVGRAKCCEGETFDELTGAMIALARAYGKDPTAAAMKVLEVMSAVKTEEPKLHITDKFGMDYGRVGDPTPYKDERGVALRVGDEVRVKSLESNRVYGSRWVVETKELGPFVMGIQVACNPKTGKIREWEVNLNSTYKEREAGEEADDGVLFVRSVEEMKRRKPLDDLNFKGVRA